MSCYTIHRPMQPWTRSQVSALDATSAVKLAARLGWYETDVLRDDVHIFTVRIEPSGLWCILPRPDCYWDCGPLSILSDSGS